MKRFCKNYVKIFDNIIYSSDNLAIAIEIFPTILSVVALLNPLKSPVDVSMLPIV